MSSISAPIFGFGAELVAVIGIGSPIQRVNPQSLARFVPAVVRAGRAASAACGHTEPT